ncbi:MAG: PAS domain-containing protein [Treponemataceae bacterium]
MNNGGMLPGDAEDSVDEFLLSPNEKARRALREQAEKIAKEKAHRAAEDGDALSPEDAQRMIHELRVHQIELEMQNGELRQAQVELDAARSRYYDLYDLAPVGYLTISEQGLILEPNLTAAALLSTPRPSLTRKPITRFITQQDQDIYYFFRQKLFDTGVSAACELRMQKTDGTPFWGRMEGIVRQEADGSTVYRIVLSDVTERKMEESKADRDDPHVVKDS